MGAVRVSTVTCIAGDIPGMLMQCEAVQKWAAAVEQLTSAQAQHAVLCAHWTEHVQQLTHLLQNLNETGVSVGKNVVECARKLAQKPAEARANEWVQQQTSALARVNEHAAIEEQVPHLEMDFHVLSDLDDKAVQGTQAPVLVQRLQQAIDMGFVELEPLIEKAQALCF